MTSTAPRSDEELMASYVAGDDAAFRELFRRYDAKLRRIILSHTHVRADAHELVQQTFLQLHGARDHFEPGRRVRPWIMTIAFNLMREHFRRRQVRQETPLWHEPEAPVCVDADRLARAEERERVLRALETIPPGQRLVIRMHWLEELSFAEVAERLGLTRTAVKVRAHRGYQALREALVSEDELAAAAA